MNMEEILIIIVCSLVGCMLCCSCYQYSIKSENEYFNKKRRAMKVPRKRVSPTSTFIEIDYDIMETRDVESNHHS